MKTSNALNKRIAIGLCGLCVFVGLTTITTSAFANQNPRSLATDNRIKVVGYNENDVVTVVGSHLVATGIRFSQEESVLSIVNGDPIAWTTAVNKALPYMVYIKPVLPDSNTNMTVVTNKHVYQFHLVTHSCNSASSKAVTYMLSFKYPEEEKAKLERDVMGLQKTFLGSISSDPVEWNYNYSFFGSRNIAPIQAVDNGTFTIFKFQKHVPIPAIFAVDTNQNESLLNFKVQGDYVFVQGVRHQYTFRNGNEVTTVYNDSFRRN